VLDFLVSSRTSRVFAELRGDRQGLAADVAATVHKHISTLERKGFIRRGYNQSRSIEVTQLPKSVREQVQERNSTELPMAGRIAAGGHSRPSRSARRFRLPSSLAAATVLCCK